LSTYFIKFISLLIIIPAAYSISRLPKVGKEFIPFLLLIWICFVTESLTILLRGSSFFVAYNTYCLGESLLIIWQFCNWQRSGKRSLYILLSIIFFFTWIYENLYLGRISGSMNIYFCIFYSIVTVFMCMEMISKLLMTEKQVLYKNSYFLICTGLLIYSTISVITLLTYTYSISLGWAFRNGVSWIIVFTDLICCFVYTLAILWMPKKKAFSSQY
jgi:hypothetical protein